MQTQPNRVRRWRWPLAVAGLIIVVAGVVAVVLARGSDASNAGNLSTAVVQRGPLTISVTESGTIRARDQVIIKSEVEGQTTIIYLVPEGTLVKEGDLLVELDASAFQDQLVEQQIRVQNAEAGYVQARENLEVVRSLGVSDVSKAELNHRFAREDLNQYRQGEFPKLLKEAESKITLAKEELERASEKFKWSQTLFDEKYISQTELEADRLTSNRAQLDHELAIASRDLLKDFTYQRRIAELESAIDQTRMELDRMQRRAKADLIQAEANLKAKEAEFRQQQNRLDKINTQIAKTKINAPINGMVVYATSAQGSWRGNAEPLDEGQQVRERQELIYLPTADSMTAEIKVHESSLDKVKLDMPVRITVDALPGKLFTGRVAKIAPLPDAQSIWMNPDLKVFTTLIHLDGGGEGLRTGMTCRAEVIVEQYAQATYVPLQSVIRISGQPTVFVVGDGEPERRQVVIGLDNNRMVKIDSGLEPGERVLLAPPLSAATDTRQPPAEAAADTPATNAEPTTATSQTTPAVASPVASPGPDAGGQQPENARRRLENMTPEQREQMRQRFESMSPEERQRLREQRQRQRDSGTEGG